MSKDKEPQELVVASQARELAARSSAANPIAAMLQTIVEGGVTAENADALEKVCDLYLKMEANGAAKDFAAAKCLLQSELPTVMATKSIPSKTGEIRSVFAPYEEIMGVVGPYLTKHGFSVSFTMKAESGRMEAVCTLTHSGGHSASNSFSVRVGSGPPGCSEAQSDGSARSYARRGALCDCLNIVVDKDTDARLEGACITAEQARDLESRAHAAGIAEAAFLRLAGAASFATIREHKVPVLEQVLRNKTKGVVVGEATGVSGQEAAAAQPDPEPPALSDSAEPTAAQGRVLDACIVLADKATEKGKKTSAGIIMAWATKKATGEATTLETLSDADCEKVLATLKEAEAERK